MFELPSRVPVDAASDGDAALAASGVDTRTEEFRLVARIGAIVAGGFGLGELGMVAAFGDLASAVGAAALFLFAGWIPLRLAPRIGRGPLETLVIRFSVVASPVIVLAGLPQPGAGAIAALLPVAVALPYLEWRHLRWLAALSFALAALVAGGGYFVMTSSRLPPDLLIALNIAGVMTATGMLMLLVAQFEGRLRTTTSELAAIVDLSFDLAQTLDAREIGNRTARAIAKAVGADEAAVSYWDRPGDRVLTYGYYPAVRRTALADAYLLTDYPATRRVLEEHHPMLVSDEDPSADAAEVAYLHSIGQRSMVMVPLVVQGVAVGAIEATASRPWAFKTQHVAMAASLVGEAAMALENGRLYEEVQARAFNDSLTGLSNRDLFRDRLRHALARRPAGAGRRVGVLLVDLDNFKSINDSFGHSGGDDLLAAVAARVAGAIRPGDTAARLGGDEFAILMDDLDNDGETAIVARRLLDVLRAPVRIGSAAAVIGASIGIAVAVPGEVSEGDLLRNADFAMYQAKSRGKGRYEIFEAALRDAAAERTALEERLRGAVGRGELVVHYQPIVELNGGRIAGLEALVRWDVPGRGLLLPGAFIGAAEDSGQIVEIGRWVLGEACRRLADWQTRLERPSLSVSVNVSARQFQDPDLVPDVVAALVDAGLEPSSLILEITESILMGQTAATIGKLADLRRLGVRLAADDFGTGYSSLSYLEKFPVDILKIDKTFVDSVGRREGRPVLARAIIQLGRALGLEVVAEGIERPEQANALRRLGCPHGQGYLYARPAPASEIEGFLAAGTIGTQGDARGSAVLLLPGPAREIA
jgi:diguanylate cyclase (GGDEF)-like protein